MSQTRQAERGCVIIPAYNEERRIGAVVRGAREQMPPTIVVDDGSRDGTAREAEAAGAAVLRHEVNRGKGAALATGFSYARGQGFDYVITMDGDGQHDPADLPKFVARYVSTGIPVLIGNRMAGARAMPWVRRTVNRVMSWLLSREMGQTIPDTQCGFRLFRCDVVPLVAAESACYAAESEILLHVAERGIRLDTIPVATIYRDEKSKISPVRDTVRFFAMIRHYRRQRRAARSV